MDKNATLLATVGGRNTKSSAQPSDSTITFLINFARLYNPVKEKEPERELMN